MVEPSPNSFAAISTRYVLHIDYYLHCWVASFFSYSMARHIRSNSPLPFSFSSHFDSGSIAYIRLSHTYSIVVSKLFCQHKNLFCLGQVIGFDVDWVVYAFVSCCCRFFPCLSSLFLSIVLSLTGIFPSVT